MKEEGFVVLRDLEEKIKENDEAVKEVQKIINETNKTADKIESASDMINGIAEERNFHWKMLPVLKKLQSLLKNKQYQ